MREEDPVKKSREIDEWFNKLPDVPTEEIPKIDDLIAGAMRQLVERHETSIFEFRNWQVRRRTQPLTQAILSPVEDKVYKDSANINSLTGTINVARDAAKNLRDRKN